jgi:hypothetical protein
MTRLRIAACLLTGFVSIAQADSVRWRVPVGTIGAANLAIDATHVYVAIPESGSRGRIVRVPRAGGTAEPVASLPFSPLALVIDGAALAVAGVDSAVAPPAPNGRIARVAKARDGKVELVARVPGAVWSLAVSQGALYAVVDNRIVRVANGSTERVAATRELAVDWLASGTPHVFAIAKQSGIDALFAFDADLRHAQTVGVDHPVSLVVAGDTAYVASRTDVSTFDARGNGSVVVEDLKRPVIAASDDGVVIATQGNIAHIPGYAGAVLWLDARAHATKLVYPQAASAVAVAGDRIYAIIGSELVALARP